MGFSRLLINRTTLLFVNERIIVIGGLFINNNFKWLSDAKVTFFWEAAIPKRGRVNQSRMIVKPTSLLSHYSHSLLDALNVLRLTLLRDLAKNICGFSAEALCMYLPSGRYIIYIWYPDIYTYIV